MVAKNVQEKYTSVNYDTNQFIVDVPFCVTFRKIFCFANFLGHFAWNNLRDLGFIKDFAAIKFRSRDLYKDFVGIRFSGCLKEHFLTLFVVLKMILVKIDSILHKQMTEIFDGLDKT